MSNIVRDNIYSRKQVLFFSALAFSLIIHIFFSFCFVVYFKPHTTPVFYSWLDILSENNTDGSSQSTPISGNVYVSMDELRKEYFFPVVSVGAKTNINDSILWNNEKIETANITKDAVKYVYLWKKDTFFSLSKKEIIPYNAFVSPYGKIILSFPRRLPLNSRQSIDFQQYLRESTFFIDDKFFWTKVEGVVK